MAVVANADPVDRALDELAAVYDLRDQGHIDTLIAAAAIAAWWEIVADRAVATHDHQLLVIASREREHARAALGALAPP